MVDGQVRPNKVIDPRIIRAMRTLPRERFLPPALAALAYIDEDVPLPGGRALMEPMVIARLVQLARVRAGRARAGGGRRVGLRRGACWRRAAARSPRWRRTRRCWRSPAPCCPSWRRGSTIREGKLADGGCRARGT